MKLNLRSNIFKSHFESRYIEIDENSVSHIYICDDKNVPKIKSAKDAQDVVYDFTGIASNTKEIKGIIFNFIKPELIEKILKIKVPTEEIRVFFSKIDYSIFNNIDLSKLKNLYFYEVESIQNSTNKFSAISQMEELETLEIVKCKGLDLNSLFKNIPNPEKIKKLRLHGNLPTIEELSKFTNLEELEIAGIEDFDLLCAFLNNTFLGNVKKLNITNCNMHNVGRDIIKRFESLTEIILENNVIANYNQFLADLPNAESVEKISFKGDKNGYNYKIKESLLEKYKNLKSLELGSLNINLENLHEFLIKTKKLENFTLNDIYFDNLDFIKDVNPNMAICLKNFKGIDISLLTPEVARSHLQIYYADEKNKVVTYSEKDNGFSLITECGSNTLYFVEPLIKEASYMHGATVDIATASNGINQTLVFLTPYADKCKDGYITIFEDYSKITLEDIDRLNENDRLKNVVVADKNNDDRKVLKRFTYDVNDAKLIEEKVREITDDIPRDLPDIDKFMIIYRRLGSRIIYDMGIIGENSYLQYAKDNVDDSRNSKNGLIRNTCVCAGYADILYNCLRKVGINAYKISGISGEYHQWNIVELDGKLYNVDLTWDAPTIAKGDVRDLSYCLIGDDEFKKSHTTTSGFDGKCPKAYSKSKIKKAYKRAMEFDNIPYKKNIFEKLKDRISGSNKKKMALPPPNHVEQLYQTEDYNGDVIQSVDSRYEKVPSWVLDKSREKAVKRKLDEVHKNNNNSKSNGDINSDKTIDNEN